MQGQTKRWCLQMHFSRTLSRVILAEIKQHKAHMGTNIKNTLRKNFNWKQTNQRWKIVVHGPIYWCHCLVLFESHILKMASKIFVRNGKTMYATWLWRCKISNMHKVWQNKPTRTRSQKGKRQLMLSNVSKIPY